MVEKKGDDIMRVLLVGSGGREHAIAWKITQSRILTKLFVAPGNAGISEYAELVNIQPNKIDDLVNFAVSNKIDYVIVGPEEPLWLGITDKMKEKGIPTFGPSKAAAVLEGSKVYAKNFMKKYKIPTARYESFKDRDKAVNALNDFALPIVIKADGLAAGKGVIIARTHGEAIKAIDELMVEKRFGDAGKELVIEEFLLGTEASQLCFVDGTTIIPFDTVQDYKREGDGDTGENTGGMGTYSPSVVVGETEKRYIYDRILLPFVQGLKGEGLEYKGLIFIGLMINEGKAKVVEFNVRFGDPEAQSLIPRMKSDLLDLMIKTTEGKLDEINCEWDKKAAVTVIMASGGYPREYEKEKEISGLDILDGVNVFHSATKKIDGKTVSNGGRVLGITALADSIEMAREKVYKEIKKISFDGAYYRSDIAKF